VVVLKIKAVLFDLGDTLVKTWIPEAFQSVLASLGIDRSIGEIREALAKTDKNLEESNYRSRYGEDTYTEFWERWDSQALTFLGISETEHLAKQITERWYDHAKSVAYPDVRATLNRLKQMGLKVGLISNAYDEDINAILANAGLAKGLFDILVGVNAVKKGKPHPDVFRYALSKLGVRPEEALFVGDQVDKDYRGAEAVGIHALLIERKSKSPDDISDLERVRSLQEIFKFIE
jgi:putative hydrolase of the HAD superfamily